MWRRAAVPRLLGVTTPRAPHRRPRLPLLVASLAAALGCVGCGGGDPAPPAVPPPSPAASAPAPPATPVPKPPHASPPAAPPAAPAGGGSAALPRCTSAQLGVTLGPAEGAAGSVHRPLVFTNTGGRACELRGFCGVSYVAGDDGHQVGPAAQRVGERGGQVRIDPGASAAAALQLVQVGAFDPAACRPTAVRGLRVYPPGEKAALFVPAEGTGCAGTPSGPQLTVRTVAAR
jgi:uncharacterized protein DUF4232